MTPRKAIDQAIAIFVEDRNLNLILISQGMVRVPVIPDMPATPEALATDPTPTASNARFVTFTIEETVLGKRLMADFEGHKEFTA